MVFGETVVASIKKWVDRVPLEVRKAETFLPGIKSYSRLGYVPTGRLIP
jgi:hypothetical protein